MMTAMSGHPEPSDDDFLKDPSGDIAKLRQMGITDYAIITYVVRVREGQDRDVALRALLQGRTLSNQQKQLVSAVLSRFPIR